MLIVPKAVRFLGLISDVKFTGSAVTMRYYAHRAKSYRLFAADVSLAPQRYR